MRMQKQGLFLILILVVIQSGFVPTISADFENDAQWRMYHYDSSHQGYTTSSPPNNIRKWSTQINASQIISSPAVVNNYVYFGASDGKLYCLNALNGHIVWTYATGGAISSSPAIVDSKVYFGSADYSVYCLDARTGEVIWSHQTGDVIDISSPVVVDGAVYIGSWDKNVYCLNAADGKIIWIFQTEGRIYSSPAVLDGKVYIGSDDSTLYCLDAVGNADGTTNLFWSYTAGNKIRSTPTIADDKIYFGCFDNYIYCLDSKGDDLGGTTLLWKYRYGDYRMRSSPAYYDGRIYVYAFDSIHCLDATGYGNGTTQLYWKTWIGSIGFIAYSSPVVTHQYIYGGSSSSTKFYCLYKNNGTIAWTVDVGVIYTSPAIVNGSVYFAATPQYSQHTFFYCYGRDNQPPVQAHTIKGPTTGYVDTEYVFTIEPVNDPDGDEVEYKFDWGDGTVSLWTSQPQATHIWKKEGNFSIRVLTRDTPHHQESIWSAPIAIHIGAPKTQLLLYVQPTVMEGEEFTVTVYVEGKYVASALVEFNNQILPTDLSGKVRFTAPYVKTITDYSISASHPSYASSIKTVKILKEKKTQGYIYGVVTDGINPLPDVQILITNKYQTWTTTTDAQGVYYRAVPPGLYSITAEKKEYRSQTQNNVEIIENIALDINFNLEKQPNPPIDQIEKDDTKTLVETIIRTAISKGYIAAKISLYSQSEKTMPYIDYYLDDYKVQPLQTDELVSFSVSASETSQKTFFLVFIGSDIHVQPEELSVYFDGTNLQKLSINDFLNPEQTQDNGYLFLSAREGNYIVIHVDHFSEHVITISTTILQGITILGFYLLFASIIALLLVSPAVISALYTTYRTRRK